MENEAEDQSVLKSIRQLAEEEHRLYSHEALTDADRARLAKINVELDVAAASSFAKCGTQPGRGACAATRDR
jgi:hypothetical protein